MTARTGTRTASGPRLSEAAAEAWIPRTCFKHGPPARVGVELELFVHPLDTQRVEVMNHSGSTPDLLALRTAALAHPVQGRVTLEPGGQLELSATPHDELVPALLHTGRDLESLRRLAAEHGTRLEGAGLDTRPAPDRVLTDPRYSVMEAYLDRWGPAGRMMMRSSASVQVNLEAASADAGGSTGSAAGSPFEHRWTLLHTIGPALVAAFATSPGRTGRWAGWSSTRQGVWLALDGARTREPSARTGESLPQAWARWCLDAPLMLVRREHGPWTAPAGATFRDWIDAGQTLVGDRPAPTLDDLADHLSTLFPPVRARGHLEVRYIDAQPGDWWQVPVGVLVALVTDTAAADRALAACAGQRGWWRRAARWGLRDPGLRRAARGVLEAAASSLRADPRTAAAAPAVEAYLEHWTARGRSPGDDLLAGRAIPAAPALGHPTQEVPR
jgi:glutamate--cysteine ligase